MSSSKAVTVIVVILVIVGGIWYFTGSKTGQTGANAVLGTENQIATTTPVVEDPTIKDVSDDQINNDLSGIDDSLKTLGSDAAGIDQSLNDKAIPQVQ
ncbi:MAG: hypothetical protein WCT19_00715 [Candidatus Paceibacterota bacterium]|jgi:hypothetical protein